MIRTLLTLAAGIGVGVAVTFAVDHDHHKAVKVTQLSQRDIIEKLDGKAASATVVEVTFEPGQKNSPHRHTGPVWGYTSSGAWKYKEYDYVNRAGSFLYEPAGSIHTLTCIEDDTQVWFHMYGVNLNLAEDGSIESVADGAGALAAYYALCEAQGFDRPNVIVA